MAFLEDLLEGIGIKETRGPANPDITGISIDSRQLSDGYLFVAMRGTQADGHSYIGHAVRAGARAVLCETFPGEFHPEVTYIRSTNTRSLAGRIASRFYGEPSAQLEIVGVTGTNGKTTVATLCYRLFQSLGESAGLFSTVENRIGDRREASTHTTPDPVQLHRVLGEMVEAGCKLVFMEISSHALDQDRIAGLKLAGAIFTNITHDHLDYHGDFRSYIDAKKKLFDRLDQDAFALINGDSRQAGYMVQNTRAGVRWFALRSIGDFSGRILGNSIEGLEMKVDGREVHFRLPGDYNASNLLAAYGCAVLLGIRPDTALQALSSVTGPEGRMDLVRKEAGKVTGIVDYAHTPDAVEKLLRTVGDLQTGPGRVLIVIGCGGDRDRKKRPVMGRIASTLSDLAIFTSDNPRSEEPSEILRAMEEGVPAERADRVLLIEDREQAIRTACQMARDGDILVLAGKGHEKYQEIKGRKLSFDDKMMLGKYLSGHTKM